MTFLKLAGAASLFALSACALTSNGVPILLREGFDRGTAASLAGLIGIGSIAGRLGGGYLLDRFDAGKVAAVSVLSPIVTAILLLTHGRSERAAATACLVLGLALGTEFDACAYLAARHFERRHFGALFGMLAGLLLFFNGVAPTLANYVYDVTRSYDIVLWAIIPCSVVAAGLFLLLSRNKAVAIDKTWSPSSAK
jgi:cyanate permease